MSRAWLARTTEEIYAYRCDKPRAVIGLPFIGRHWAYVGRSNNGARRDREHLQGGTWNGRPIDPKPWADLNPRRYVIRKRKQRLEITTHFLEWLTIKMLLPVYNVSMNASNPRRIRRRDQIRQRATRIRRPMGVRIAIAATRAALMGAVLAVLVGAAIMAVPIT